MADECKYTPPSSQEVFITLQKFDSIVLKYLETIGVSKEKVHFNIISLGNLVVRVDKRKKYYHIYHDDLDLSAPKRAALTAYWILKFKPFTHLTNETTELVSLNEGFAAYIILGAINETLSREGMKLELSDQYLATFMYALKFWDLTKEALMLIAETLYMGAKARAKLIEVTD